MYQRPFWGHELNPNSINNWNLFKDDALKFLDQNNLFNSNAIGHSMGAIIILLIEIENPGTFKKIFLLDPVITSRFKSFIYKVLVTINLIDIMHPMIKATNRKKMRFENKELMYKSYRNKNIFSKIKNDDLMCYIDSIIEPKNDGVKIKISKEWENTIYRTGSIHDNKIWKNINKIKCPSYVILPKKNQFGHFHYGEKLKHKNRNFKNLFIENSTHLFPIESPQKTADLILKNINI
jgi:pimeloyl-ACP methyl ester carboxylesterase